jgi:hypothetical protein
MGGKYVTWKHTAFLCEDMKGGGHMGCGDVCRVVIMDLRKQDVTVHSADPVQHPVILHK